MKTKRSLVSLAVLSAIALTPAVVFAQNDLETSYHEDGTLVLKVQSEEQVKILIHKGEKLIKTLDIPTEEIGKDIEVDLSTYIDKGNTTFIVTSVDKMGNEVVNKVNTANGFGVKKQDVREVSPEITSDTVKLSSSQQDNLSNDNRVGTGGEAIVIQNDNILEVSLADRSAPQKTENPGNTVSIDNSFIIDVEDDEEISLGNEVTVDDEFSDDEFIEDEELVEEDPELSQEETQEEFPEDGEYEVLPQTNTVKSNLWLAGIALLASAGLIRGKRNE